MWQFQARQCSRLLQKRDNSMRLAQTGLRLGVLAAFVMTGLALAGSDQVLAQKRRASAIIPGGNAKAPINISAGRLDFLNKENKLIYSGGVLARQGDATLKCSTLTIFLAKDAVKSSGAGDAGSSDQVRRMEAAGPVTITSRDQVGTGNRGIYDKVKNVVYLIGNPVLTQGANITKGGPNAQLVYDLNSSRARISGGRVTSILVPSKGKNAPQRRTRD